jgi:hypothetical protein
MRGRRGARGPAIAVALALATGLAACGSNDEPEPNEGTAIVSIGDSLASGEGNPAHTRHPWLERRCHRSAAAGQTLAGERAAIANPGTAFYSFACSGATIVRGLLGPYKGIEPSLVRGPAAPQVDEVAKVKAASKGGLAALLVSVGANDVGFVKIFEFCLVVPRCPEQHFNPKLPIAEAGAGRPTLERWVRERLGELPAGYARLDDAIGPLLPADRVLIAEYFDPTTDADGSDCMILGGVKPAESRWAREHVLAPLNDQVQAAADEHGWRVVPGVAEAFRGHGLCARKQRWVRSLGEGPLTGTLHPNVEGHRQIAALIDPVLAEVLSP